MKEKPLEDFEQRNDMTGFAFLKESFNHVGEVLVHGKYLLRYLGIQLAFKWFSNVCVCVSVCVCVCACLRTYTHAQRVKW